MKSPLTRLLPLTAALAVLTAGCVPSPSSMARDFESRRSGLERVVSMMLEDPKLMNVRPTSFAFEPDVLVTLNPPSPIAQERWPISRASWQEYRELFAEAGLPYGAARCGPNTIVICIHARGMLLRGNEEGYIYSREPFIGAGDCSGYVVLQIRDSWYAYNLGR